LIQTEKTSGENLGFFFAFLYEQLLFSASSGTALHEDVLPENRLDGFRTRQASVGA
jgi:hypothetical protein